MGDEDQQKGTLTRRELTLLLLLMVLLIQVPPEEVEPCADDRCAHHYRLQGEPQLVTDRWCIRDILKQRATLSKNRHAR